MVYYIYSGCLLFFMIQGEGMRFLFRVFLLVGCCSAAARELPVFQTSGRFLLDPCGDTVIIRGVEVPVKHKQYLPEIAETGANFVRLLFSIPPAKWSTSPADLDTILALTRKLGMAVDIALNNEEHDGSAYVDAAYLPVLKKYEDILTLHAQGEGKQATTEEWIADAKSAIDIIRGEGLRCPLYILSNPFGRNPFPVLHHGREIVDYDPLHNILLGVQLYWGYEDDGTPGWYINKYGMTDEDAIDSFSLCDFPVVAGINNHDPYGDPWLDYETQLSQCRDKRISWFWWDWYNQYDGKGKYHLSTTGKYGDWGVVAAGAPELDKLTVSGGGSSKTYEAEEYSSIAGNGWGKISHSSVSGGAFLCCSGKRIPDWAEWDNIDGGSGGRRSLTITYDNGSKTFAKPLKVVCNGDTVGTLQCKHTEGERNDGNFWRVWGQEDITISLQSGMNTIRLVSTETMGHFHPDYGYRTVISHPASIKNTSKRTHYMTEHTCDDIVANRSACSGMNRRTFGPTTSDIPSSHGVGRAIPASFFAGRKGTVLIHDVKGRLVGAVHPHNTESITGESLGLRHGTYYLSKAGQLAVRYRIVILK